MRAQVVPQAIPAGDAGHVSSAEGCPADRPTMNPVAVSTPPAPSKQRRRSRWSRALKALWLRVQSEMHHATMLLAICLGVFVRPCLDPAFSSGTANFSFWQGIVSVCVACTIYAIVGRKARGLLRSKSWVVNFCTALALGLASETVLAVAKETLLHML